MVYKFGEGQTVGPTYANQSGYATGSGYPGIVYAGVNQNYPALPYGGTYVQNPYNTSAQMPSDYMQYYNSIQDRLATGQITQSEADQMNKILAERIAGAKTGYPVTPVTQQQAATYSAGLGGGSGAGGDMSAYLNAGKMLTAPMSDEEKQALANASSLVEMIMDMPYFQDTEMGQAAQAAIMEALSGQFPEEYYQNAIYNPTLKQYQEDVLPTIQEAFAGPGTFWGSERAIAEQKAGQNLEDYLTQRRAELAQWAKTRQDTGVGTSMAYQSLINQEPLGRLGANETLMAMGAIPRSIEQHALDIAYQEFLRTRPSSNPYISQAMGMLNIPTIVAYSPSGVTTNAFQGLGNNINNLMQYYAMQQYMNNGNYGLNNTAWTPNYSTYNDYYY